MKSILIISSITFLLIFGGIGALSLQISKQAHASAFEDPNDAAANERLLRNVAAERDRLQREREYLAGFEQSQAARDVLMERVHQQLLAVVEKIEVKQNTFVAEQDEAANRLAKMYEGMKAPKAASILAAMDMDISIAIIKRMKDRQAAKVLSFMDAGMAAQISTRLSLQQGA